MLSGHKYKPHSYELNSNPHTVGSGRDALEVICSHKSLARSNLPYQVLASACAAKLSAKLNDHLDDDKPSSIVARPGRTIEATGNSEWVTHGTGVGGELKTSSIRI